MNVPYVGCVRCPVGRVHHIFYESKETFIYPLRPSIAQWLLPFEWPKDSLIILPIANMFKFYCFLMTSKVLREFDLCGKKINVLEGQKTKTKQNGDRLAPGRKVGSN